MNSRVYQLFPANQIISYLLKGCVIVLCFPALSGWICANPEISTSDDQTTMIVNEAPEQQIVSIGKNVLVKRHAKEVIAIGGDVIVEGEIQGDVATIGGHVIQKEGGYVGGDVIVIGGTYRSESQLPLREEGKQTIVFGFLEDELRSLGQNPSQIFAPSFSIAFLAQRAFVALLWFVISMVITTLAPGAVSRAVARIQLSALKVCALGAASFLLVMGLTVGGVAILPGYLAATLFFMGLLILILGYVFGCVSIQLWLGKLLQRRFLSETSRSETLATLLGVLAWTLMLSLPYVWLLVLFTTFAFGIGLILTGRVSGRWQTP